jgi:hypothetical protein
MEKKGKPRSHIGNLDYKREKYGDVFNSNNLGKIASNMNMEDIENKVKEELKLPDNLMTDLE